MGVSALDQSSLSLISIQESTQEASAACEFFPGLAGNAN